MSGACDRIERARIRSSAQQVGDEGKGERMAVREIQRPGVRRRIDAARAQERAALARARSCRSASARVSGRPCDVRGPGQGRRLAAGENDEDVGRQAGNSVSRSQVSSADSDS